MSRFLFVQYIHGKAIAATVALFALTWYSGQCTLDTQTSTTEETEVTRSVNLALDAHEFEKALPLLQQLVKEGNFSFEGPRQAIYNKTGLAHLGIAINEYYDDQYDIALEHLNQAVEYNPYDSRSYTYRGAILADKEEWEKAILDYNLALEFNSSAGQTPIIYALRASALRHTGRLPEAIRDLTSIIETYKAANQQTYIESGLSYCMQGQFYNSSVDFNVCSV